MHTPRRHRWSAGRTLAACLLAAGLAGCATTVRHIHYQPTPECPRVVTLTVGGAYGPQGRYVADGVRACRELHGLSYDPDHGRSDVVNKQVEVRPSPARWTAFRAALDRLEIDRWKPVYSPADVGTHIDDGIGWRLTVATLRSTRQSAGDNAYPTPGRPRRTTLDTASFDRLHDAFKQLTGEPVRW